MAFSGYYEDRRGKWFGGGTSMLYGEGEYYIANEQECSLIRVRDDKQIELLHHCMSGNKINREVIDWIIDPTKGRFTYYDSVQEFIDSRK